MERVADYVIRKVNEAGARHIFFISGRGILYLTDAVAKNNNIEAVCTYHEQGASYAAMAYASVNKGVSACLVSTGCASTNALTACLCAYQDNIPVVFISGNNPLNENKRHTGKKIRTYGSQEADIISIVQSVTKYSVMLENTESVVYEVEKALYLAQQGRKGPVWIDVPLDIQNMRIEENELKHFIKPETCLCQQYEIEQIAEEINASNRPVFLIGGGSRVAKKQLRIFAETYNIPVVCSPVAVDIYGTDNELSIGTVGSIGGSRSGNFAVQNSDFVLAIGSKLCSQLTGKREYFARDAKIVAVDIDESEHTKSGVVDKVVISDSEDFMTRLLRCNIIKHDKTWADKCVRWKKLFSLKNESFIKEVEKKDEIDLYSLTSEISCILPDNATIITDAGFEELIVPSAISYRDGQRCLFPAAQGAMGYAIPAIIGAFTAGRENMICIVGDGSIMMNIQELQIISSMKIPVKIIVINNCMYAVIRKRQKDLFRKRTIGNDPSDGVPQPSFKSIAECFGFDYQLIRNRTELMSSLTTLLQGKAEIIEIMCTPEQSYLHESYAVNEQHRLVHRPIEDMSPFLSRELIRDEMIVSMLEE